MDKTVNKSVKYVAVFFIPAICMAIHMMLYKCYPFGDHTILIGDANSQYYIFVQMLFDKIKAGEPGLLSWHGGLGLEFYQNFFYYLASPFVIIALFIGIWDLELGVVVAMIVQIGMCSVTMMYYLCHTYRGKAIDLRVKPWICALFALSYSFCGYMLAYQYTYIWLISLMMAPLVMLGVEQLVREGNSSLYIAALIITFITNFYFSWFICLLSVVWYIDSCPDVKKLKNSVLRYILSSVISALVCAAVLVPCYCAVIGKEYRLLSGPVNKVRYFGNIADFLQGFLWGSSIDTLGSNIFTHNNYVGIVSLCGLVLYFFCKSMSRIDRIKRCVLVVALVVCSNWLLGVYVFHGFTYPNMFCNRHVFILLLLIIVSAYEFLSHVTGTDSKRAICGFACFGGIILYILLKNDTFESTICYVVSCSIALYVFGCLMFHLKRRISRNVFFINVIVVGILEIIANYYFVGFDSYDISMTYKGASRKWEYQYQSIDIDAGERKTSWIAGQNNMAYSDTNIFSSVLSTDIGQLYDSLGMIYQGNGNSYAYRGTTPVTAAMFNVSYVLADSPVYYGGYTKKDSTKVHNDYLDCDMECGLYENDYVCGLGYVVDKSIEQWSITDDNPFIVQNNLTNSVLGIGDVFEEVKISEGNLYPEGCSINSVENNTISYINTLQSDESYARISFVFVIPEDMQLYVNIQDKNQTMCSVYVDSEARLINNMYRCLSDTLYIGSVKSGQIVTIVMDNNTSPGIGSDTKVNIYKYNDDVMTSVIDKLRTSPYTLSNFSSGTVKGSVDSKEEGILYTSIPYYKGIKVYVDGEEKDIIKIGGALCGVELCSGVHEVVFKYFPYGLKIGILLSIVGVLLLYLYLKNAYKSK